MTHADSMLVVAGLSLKNLNPRAWDPASPNRLPALRAVMVSYAEFHRLPWWRDRAEADGLHAALGVPGRIKVYLDNGAFHFRGRAGTHGRKRYERFVELARPDWYPIPYDSIPSPGETRARQRQRFYQTRDANLAYRHDAFVPVVHVGPFLEHAARAIRADAKLRRKGHVALGAIVPNLLRSPKALAYADVLEALVHVRGAFRRKRLHVFGIGGTATLHLAALLGIDSVDSSGWRNRAARGIVQLPGRGDRLVADLGKWRGRRPDEAEWRELERCPCPACRAGGRAALTAQKLEGFSHRATHNLHVLLQEAAWVRRHLRDDTYPEKYRRRLVNSIYTPLVDALVARRWPKRAAPAPLTARPAAPRP